jgi:protein involved in polysaccharide export with SLBB domain
MMNHAVAIKEMILEPKSQVAKLVTTRLRVLLAASIAVLGALATAPAAAHAQSADASPAGESVLRPGDVVRLQIWREESLSGEFAVAKDGTVVLPRIGRYDVTTDPPDVVRDRMLEAFQQYLRNPSIEITFLRRITVLGSVRNAGVHFVDPTMTIAEAIGLAGGTAPDGANDRVLLMRGDQTILTVAGHVRIADTPLRSGDQLFVPERSWVSRNQGVVAAVVSGLISVAVAFIIR